MNHATRALTLTVDSRFRDRGRYPEPHSYVIEVDDELRNVVHVELVHALFRRQGTENFVVLHVDELQPGMHQVATSMGGTSRGVNDAFTVIPLKDIVQEYNGGYTHFRSVARFAQPLARLSRLTVSFTDYCGRPYSVGEHLLRFEVRVHSVGGAGVLDAGAPGVRGGARWT